MAQTVFHVVKSLPAPESGAMKKERSIDEVVESIGYGPSQVWTGLLVNGSWLADGCELLVLSSIGTVLAAEWQLTLLQQGMLLCPGEKLKNLMRITFRI